MQQIASDREFFDAVLAALREIPGLPVGDAVAPDDTSGKYVIAYPMPSGGTSGPMSATNDDEDFVVQVTSVGRSRQSAQEAATLAKRRLLGGALTIAGRAVLGQPRLDVGAAVQRDDDTAGPPLYYAVHRYRWQTTPA